jgi:hypothetical protein
MDIKTFDITDLSEPNRNVSQFESRPIEFLMKGADPDKVLMTAQIIKTHFLSAGCKVKGPVDCSEKKKSKLGC